MFERTVFMTLTVLGFGDSARTTLHVSIPAKGSTRRVDAGSWASLREGRAAMDAASAVLSAQGWIVVDNHFIMDAEEFIEKVDKDITPVLPFPRDKIDAAG